MAGPEWLSARDTSRTACLTPACGDLRVVAPAPITIPTASARRKTSRNDALLPRGVYSLRSSRRCATSRVWSSGTWLRRVSVSWVRS